MNYWEETKGAIIAGLMIAIGGIVNLSCIAAGYPILGAFLFCVGLFTICAFKGNLYTGKVGLIPFAYIENMWGKKDFSLKAKFQFSLVVFHYLIINLITTFGIGFIVGKCYPNLAATATEIYLPKMESDLIKIFINGVIYDGEYIINKENGSITLLDSELESMLNVDPIARFFETHPVEYDEYIQEHGKPYTAKKQTDKITFEWR